MSLPSLPLAPQPQGPCQEKEIPYQGHEDAASGRPGHCLSQETKQRQEVNKGSSWENLERGELQSPLTSPSSQAAFSASSFLSKSPTTASAPNPFPGVRISNSHRTQVLPLSPALLMAIYKKRLPFLSGPCTHPQHHRELCFLPAGLGVRPLSRSFALFPDSI